MDAVKLIVIALLVVLAVALFAGTVASLETGATAGRSAFADFSADRGAYQSPWSAGWTLLEGLGVDGAVAAIGTAIGSALLVVGAILVFKLAVKILA